MNGTHTDTCYSMDGPWEHYATVKAASHKGRILYDSIYMKHPEYINPWGQKAEWWLTVLGGEGMGKNAEPVSFWGDENVLELGRGACTTS